ncbi:hypothetical protein [Niabella hibiscisoli]|uniref:hypothetical protein n=1 Tax=Niabella hibiscisoli TaxID=1825928 RepID=UPI001F0F12B2|nr:hypothetical protein [Niabella hibiscisoli]MCH5718919.1 hypothetical protein [Niabella hibiscisoli]
MIKNFLGLLIIIQVYVPHALAQTTGKTDMAVLIKENFAFADSQYQYMMKQVAPDKMPQSYDEKNKKSIAYQRTWWCTGFYPGALWYIFEQTGNPVIKKSGKSIKSN